MDFYYLYHVEHIGNKKSLVRIAEEYGTTVDILRYSFKKLGLKPRRGKIDYSEIREDAFNIWTPEMAYWLGFIAADGNVLKQGNTITVSLQASDHLHLDRLSSFLILTEGCITTYARKRNGRVYNEVMLRFISERVKSRLGDLGIILEKSSCDIDFLDSIPDIFKPYFLVGYFDGDGSYGAGGRTPPRVLFLGSVSFF